MQEDKAIPKTLHLKPGADACKLAQAFEEVELVMTPDLGPSKKLVSLFERNGHEISGGRTRTIVCWDGEVIPHSMKSHTGMYGIQWFREQGLGLFYGIMV